MKIEQLYTKCLSEAAYYIESEGEVAIVDPLRDIDVYINMAHENKSVIKYIFETHFHADFVSGHLDLARKTGATIIYGPNADAKFKFHKAHDGELFHLGDISIQVLHTPGHTLESSCYLLSNEKGKPYCVFTGDTLFVGDVGRPDLAVKSGDITQEDLASLLFDSLRTKLMPLDDDVIVYPAHGAGSSCGKNIGAQTFSTIGKQKQENYALKDISKANFINEVTNGILAPPAYFFKDVMMNKNGYDELDKVIENNLKPIDFEKFKKSICDDVVVLDCRSPKDFSQGFIKGSINIGLKGQFAPWVGAIIDPKSSILLVADVGFEKEAITRLSRVGYENVLGYLKGGIEMFTDKLEVIRNQSAQQSAKIIYSSQVHVLDVREPVERANGYINNSSHIRLQELPSRILELKKNDDFIVYCAGGYRSMIACSLLAKNGFYRIINVEGGYSQLSKQNTPIFIN